MAEAVCSLETPTVDTPVAEAPIDTIKRGTEDDNREVIPLHQLIEQYRVMVRKLGVSMDMSLKQVGVRRNEPCWCNSGKKFKKCCLPKVTSFQGALEVARIYNIQLNWSFIHECRDLGTLIDKRWNLAQTVVDESTKKLEEMTAEHLEQAEAEAKETHNVIHSEHPPVVEDAGVLDVSQL